MKDHKELDVWKLSTDLAVDVYGETARFPKEEVFGLTSQIRRCAVSIPSNISEGASRATDKEFVHFLYIALGSSAELETQLILSHRLKYLDDITQLSTRIISVRKLINGLIRHYKAKMGTGDSGLGIGK